MVVCYVSVVCCHDWCMSIADGGGSEYISPVIPVFPTFLQDSDCIHHSSSAAQPYCHCYRYLPAAVIV